jgi:hypothetical protein
MRSRLVFCRARSSCFPVFAHCSVTFLRQWFCKQDFQYLDGGDDQAHANGHGYGCVDLPGFL